MTHIFLASSSDSVCRKRCWSKYPFFCTHAGEIGRNGMDTEVREHLEVADALLHLDDDRLGGPVHGDACQRRFRQRFRLVLRTNQSVLQTHITEENRPRTGGDGVELPRGCRSRSWVPACDPCCP